MLSSRRQWRHSCYSCVSGDAWIENAVPVILSSGANNALRGENEVYFIFLGWKINSHICFFILFQEKLTLMRRKGFLNWLFYDTNTLHFLQITDHIR